MNNLESSKSRILALDLTKGMLVVFMVVYHSLNYSSRGNLGFEYLAFLPPSFIMITGFLISNVYLARYSPTDNKLKTRLLARGGKLLLLFTSLNILAMSLIRNRARGEMPGLAVFFNRWFDTYITGNGRVASFEVLLPVAYLLLAAPLLLWINSIHRLVLPGLIFFTIAGLVLLEQNGMAWTNAQLFCAGLVGLLIGRISRPVMHSLSHCWLVAAPAYAVLYWFTVGVGNPYPMQVVAGCLALALLFGTCAAMKEKTIPSRCLEALGKYSLIAYIAQIGILQIMTRWTGRANPASPKFFILFISTLIFTFVIVKLVAISRLKSRVVDIAYKAVFA